MIRCIAVDDDRFSLSILEQLIKRIDDVVLIGSYLNSIDALSEIREEVPDIVFLDVEMPGLTGIDLIKLIPCETEVVLTTISESYAIEGFNLNILDYLLKPINFERIDKTIKKYKEKHLHNSVSEIEIIQNKDLEYLYVKENYKTVKILISNIIFLESYKEYVIIITIKRQVKTKQRLSYFEKILGTQSFLRIHKSYIVSTDKVLSFSNSEIEIPNKLLPIGRTYKKNVQTILLKHL